MPGTPSGALVWGFLVLSPLTLALVPLALRRVSPRGAKTPGVALVVCTAWLGITYALGASGVLNFDSFPPKPLFLFVATFATTVGIGLSRLGARVAFGIPLALLVGFQAFRIPVELLLHRAATDGVMPVQMSYLGYNFDVVSGLSALPMAWLIAKGRAPRWLVLAWNVLGLALLLTIVSIAILSMPTPMRVFSNEPANTWVTHAPFVWLPMVLVPMALLGHVLVFRRSRSEPAGPQSPRGDGER